MEKEVFLTKEGYDKLKREYDELSSTGRKEMAEKIKIAREFGDLSENAEYDAAKEEQGFLEKRIREINEMLSNCTIIDESTIDTKTVSVGCIVKLQDLESSAFRKQKSKKILSATNLLSAARSSARKRDRKSSLPPPAAKQDSKF